MKTLKIYRSTIEDEILKHFKENYDPEDKKTEYELIFDHKTRVFIYQITVPYYIDSLWIYSDNFISCTCATFDIELEIIGECNAKELSNKIEKIKDELNEYFENGKRETVEIENTQDWLDINYR